MNLQIDIYRAVTRCEALSTVSLEEFLDSLLDEDPDVLARMPGTPGEVLAAQFVCYVRQSVALQECILRAAEPSNGLIQRVMRIQPEPPKRKGT